MTGRALLTCFGYVALLALLAVGADRLIASRVFQSPGELVPAYRAFQEPSVSVKLHDLEQASGTFDTLVLGNSRTLFGVRPDIVDRVLADRGIAQRSFNLAMPTVDVRFWPRFMRDYYDRPAPKRLLLGVIPRDLDARNVQAVTQMNAFFASSGFDNRDRSAAWRGAEEWRSRIFTMHGRFNEVRRAGIGGLLRGDGLAPPQIRVSERGWGQFAPGVAPSKRELAEQARRLAVRSGSLRLAVGDEQIGALRQLDRWIRARGGCLTLFTVPVLYDREPWGTVEVRRAFERTMRAFVRANPRVGYLDLGPRTEDEYGLADFGDGDHLDPSGAGRLSRQLADALAEDPRC
ncbi:MAG: hypothetical protein Q8O56_05425 [Solirubrobacteraceae bacterium]|nr:hypothetical protein [Solirubrobacteraceae bacterium]